MWRPIVVWLFLPAWASSTFIKVDCLNDWTETSNLQQVCLQRNCIYDTSENPTCYFKSGVGYKYSQDTRSFLKNSGPINPWTGPKEYPQILFKTSTIGKTLNVKITGTNGTYYEPPIDLPKKASESSDSLIVRSYLTADPYYFEVVRKSTGRKIFDTSPGGIIMSDQFLQIVSMLPSDKFYGLGEQAHKTLKHPMDLTTNQMGLFNTNSVPNYQGKSSAANSLPGTHPFYIMLEPDSKAHGVFFLNSNAQEFNVRSAPAPNLVYRTIGGILDIYFFPGPTPEEVIRQYHAFIGKPYLPPYWSFGYQNDMDYPNLMAMNQSHNRLKDAGIPLDAAFVSTEMTNGNQDFTIDGNNFAGLPQYVHQLKSRNVKFCMELLPALGANTGAFQSALNQQAKFVEWERMDQVPAGIQNLYPNAKNTKIMLGLQSQDSHVAFLDFLDSTGGTQAWWIKALSSFYLLQFPFDGVLLYNDEPFNYGTNSQLVPLICPKSGADSVWDVPPYKTYVVYYYENMGATETMLSDITLCLLGVQNNNALRHYDVHNLYGWSAARATKAGVEAATGKRGFQISRSTFASTNRYAGHYLNGAAATWEHLQGVVVACQEFNIFGIPFVGSEICGTPETGSQELCARWHQFGAVTSFMYISGAWSANKDPGSNPTVGNATKKALQFRYNYMPYLYTLHHLASTRGGTVLRPVFFEYPYDFEAQNLNYQFMLGSAIMAAPVVFPGVSSTDVYFPDGNFYSIYEDSYGYQKEAGFTTISTPLNYNIPVFVKAGNIIPRQQYALTLTDARRNPFEVLIVPDEDQSATGMLRWDDGESIIQNENPDSYWDIQYSYSMPNQSDGMIFSVNVTQSASSVSLPSLNILEIFNYQWQPDFGSFKLNGNHVAVDMQLSRYSPITKVMFINTNGFIQITSSGLWTLTWKNLIN